LLSVTVLGADPVASTVSSAPRQDVPKLIGCVNRAGISGKGAGPEWFFILKLSNGTVETLRGHADTIDGWHICDNSNQPNRPQNVTLEKDGYRQTVQLTPEAAATQK
jgi:hypothetical protein